MKHLCSGSIRREIGKGLSDKPHHVTTRPFHQTENRGSETSVVCTMHGSGWICVIIVCRIGKNCTVMMKNERNCGQTTSLDETFPADRELRNINQLRNRNFNRFARFIFVLFSPCQINDHLFCMSVTKK